MFLLKNTILDAISQGVTYLDTYQQKDGSFLSFSSPDPKNFTNTLQFHSTFSTSLILDSLTTLPETPQINGIKQKAATFLLKQKSKNWSFNYWTRNSNEYKTMPYPDDLDDTFCALSALFHYDQKIIDGSVLAHVVSLLTATEEKEGGPYRTWLAPETAEKVWKDIDIAVNCNIAYFLSLQEIDLEQLNEYIDMCIETNTLVSPYYPSDYPIHYFLSRFYKGKHKEKIQKLLLSKKDNLYSWGNPLNTALAVTAILNLQTPANECTESIAYILKQQTKGFWQPYPFYTGVNPKRTERYYAGSSALTTAFCLETLAKYLHAMTFSVHTNVQKKNDAEEKLLYDDIVQEVEKRFSAFDSPIKKNAFIMIHKILEKDEQKQIVLLPYYFVQTLNKKKKNLPNDLIKTLGIASIFGWIAYTIYDNFLDEEGDPKMLSIANIALRELTSTFEQILPKETGFQEFFHKIMDRLDQANAWEISHCRVKLLKGTLDFTNFTLPNYENHQQLAEKSFGHGLGPLAILFSLGYTKNSLEVKNLLSFFTHYLIARQLNDDAHDWEKDLKMGQINSVGVLILRKYREEKPTIGTLNLKQEKQLSNLQKLFWYTIIDDVCFLIFEHIKQARIALKKSSIIVHHAAFEKLLVQYEKAAQVTLKEKESTIAFLHSYQ